MKERIEQLARQVDACYLSRYDTWQMDADTLQKFAELLLDDYANKLVLDNMSDSRYVKAMDQYYENKWGHRFD